MGLRRYLLACIFVATALCAEEPAANYRYQGRWAIPASARAEFLQRFRVVVGAAEPIAGEGAYSSSWLNFEDAPRASFRIVSEPCPKGARYFVFSIFTALEPRLRTRDAAAGEEDAQRRATTALLRRLSL